MASRQIVWVASRTAKVSQRAICTSAVRSSDPTTLDTATRERIYPKIGNRDIVGYGMNGAASYIDSTDFPCPSIRFKENTSDVLLLREKEKGDWKKITLEEKKQLYRTSFCQTFAEMKAPTGEWKSIISSVIMTIVFSGLFLLWMKKKVYPDMPRTITKEWQEAEVRRMIDLRSGGITGVSSKWDYESGQWKD